MKFTRDPHHDPEAFVRRVLSSMRETPLLYTASPAVFIGEVSVMLHVLGLTGPIEQHLCEHVGVLQQGAVIWGDRLVDHAFAKCVIDEAFRILDEDG